MELREMFCPWWSVFGVQEALCLRFQILVVSFLVVLADLVVQSSEVSVFQITDAQSSGVVEDGTIA